MLHLQAGVHFQKVKALVFADHKFHRARTLVIHRLGQSHRLLAHGFAGSVRDKGRWRLFNHFLVAALNRAFAFVEVQLIAMGVANELDFDVAGLFDEFFDEHAIIAKAVARFVAAAAKALEGLFVVVGHTQALAAAARAGLDHHRVANAFGNLHCFFGRLDGVVHARNTVHACFAGQFFGLDLVAHGSNRIVLGADEGNALFLAALGKFGVLAQKSVARVNGLCAGGLGGGDDHVSQQIAFAAGRRPDAHGFIGQGYVARLFVRIRIHGHGGNAHFAGGGDNAAGNFAPVGNQNFGKHFLFPYRLRVEYCRACATGFPVFCL